MIAATLHGPSYFSPNHDETSIELFPTLGDAIAALIDRYHSNGRRHCPVATLDGHDWELLFPAFDEGTGFACYRAAGFDDLPREELDTEQILTAVHGGHHDFTLTLTTTEAGDLGVMVVPA